MPNLCDEIVYPVSDAGVTELAKIGKILADLRIGESKALTELFAGDRPAVFALEALQLAEVKAQAFDRGIGDQVWSWRELQLRLLYNSNAGNTTRCRGYQERDGDGPANGLWVAAQIRQGVSEAGLAQPDAEARFA
jgi:hypothetical protein